MNELQELVKQFCESADCRAAVWARLGGSGGRLEVVAGDAELQPPPVIELLRAGGPGAEVATAAGRMYVAAVDTVEPMWVGIVAGGATQREIRLHLRFLSALIHHAQRAKIEVERAARELAERYEEIDLLYTTSEIFGRTVSLEEAAARILSEIANTVGAERAALLVHDEPTGTLQVVCAIGFPGSRVAPVPVADSGSAIARVFRERRSAVVTLEPDGPEAEYLGSGSLLVVPILWTNPGNEPLPLGVVALSQRHHGCAFGTSEEKLVGAIATQIGTAIQINRLVRASITQQQLQQEMQLASDLQLKLLPETAHFLPEARVAAKVVPAESVGGDFYHLFRLGEGRTGIMIGDVSGHGYRSALIMALVMSAASIHAQTTADPAEMLTALWTTLREELASTEMFVSLFYAVLDPRRGVLRYANAGHPHAFVVSMDGRSERLAATRPPLGIGERLPATAERVWAAGSDLLLLFTDGLTDARDAQNRRLGEEAVLEVVAKYRHHPPATILNQVLSRLRDHVGGVNRRDDLALLLARS